MAPLPSSFLPASMIADPQGDYERLPEEAHADAHANGDDCETGFGSTMGSLEHQASCSSSMNMSVNGQSARDRWKRGAAKVMLVNALTRTSTAPRAGSCQGIDVKRHSYEHLDRQMHNEVKITVVDYASHEAKLYPAMGNGALQLFLSLPRPSWSKVRWINLDGMSWDCILALAKHFDLHPLAVEDCIHVPQRVKVDFYSSSLVYCALTLSALTEPARKAAAAAGSGMSFRSRRSGPLPQAHSFPWQESAAHQSYSGRDSMTPRGSESQQDSPQRLISESLAETFQLSAKLTKSYGERGGRPSTDACWDPLHLSAQERGPVRLRPLRKRTAARSAARVTPPHMLEPNMASSSLEISAEQVSLFLTRDGTIISMFENDGDHVTQPLLHQIMEDSTLVRDSEDASYLLNLLIDSIVDVTYPLVEAFNEQLHRYEDSVLGGQAQAAFTKVLFVMQGDLATLRRTIMPLSGVVAALQAHAEVGGTGGGAHQCAPHVTPMVSSLTRTYLSDVKDHLSTILEDMEGLQQQCGALSDLVFNMIAHRQNRSMQTLSVMSSIFLPLSFMAGVYGMNFDVLPEIHWEYGYGFFWGMVMLLSTMFLLAFWRTGMLD